MKLLNLFVNRVCVNTVFSPNFINVIGCEGYFKEFDWCAGEEAAHKKGMVTGNPRHKTAITRVEHKPRFIGKPRIATTPCA